MPVTGEEMPIYTYKCEACKSTVDEFRHIADRNDPLQCECGDSMLLSIQPVRFNSPIGGYDNPGYVSPMSGEFISSKKARIDEMKRFDVVEAG